MSKFHGLSSPDELIEMWRELRYDDDDEDINVIWEYTNPKQLKEGFNIVNIKYDPKDPKAIGHYVLISKFGKNIEYFNPVSSHTKDDEDKLNELLNYAEEQNKLADVDLTGKQSEESENCGFHCLTHAYNLYKKIKGKGKEKAEEEIGFKPKEEGSGGANKIADDGDKMDTLIKTVRGIYFGLKYGFDQQTPNRKKGSGYGYGYPVSAVPRHYMRDLKGSGLADYGKDYYNYTDLRRTIEGQKK